MKGLRSAAAAALCGCLPLIGCAIGKPSTGLDSPALIIRWQRVVDEDGRTCPRCGATETEVRKAAASLRASLATFGVDVLLQEETLDMTTFQGDPTESNRIWIAGRPLEEWLGARTGQSQCCGTCGDSECRTMTVEGRTFEAIPAVMIERAGLMAAAAMIADCPPSRDRPEDPRTTGPCCPGATPQQHRALGGSHPK